MSKTHKKEDLNKKGDFENLPDGFYHAVMTDVKLDLAGKYGPNIQMTFRMKNRRLAWVRLAESQQGKMNGAWMNAKKLGIGTELSEKLGEEFSTEYFLETAFEMIEGLVGHYFELDLKTYDKTGKQYASVAGESSESLYESVKMPKKEVETSPPQMESDEIPF